MDESVVGRAQLRKLLEQKDLSFREFMELALYDERDGYYRRAERRLGKEGDFITAPLLSPAFGFAFSRLAAEFLALSGDALTAIVDIGAGTGELIRSIRENLTAEQVERASFIAIDRASGAAAGEGITVADSVEAIPGDLPVLAVSNELFDAFPVARLVLRPEGLRELWVTRTETGLDWAERDAPSRYEQYLRSRRVALQNSQYVDLSLEWGELYGRICERVSRGLVVTVDYGFRQKQLFDPRVRRFGTAAAFRGHQLSRDLLANPGEQDLTAHINFDDLIAAGESRGFSTLFFGRQAPFLLALGITEHELFAPVAELPDKPLADALAESGQRQAARRLVLPDGIGEEMKVLVQGRGVPLEGWSFQRKLF